MGVLIAQATLTWIAVLCTRSIRLSKSKYESFMDFIERPGAGYSQSEGSGAKFEVYLGRATAARALRAELKYIQTPSPLSPCFCGVPCRSLEVGS